MAALPIPTIKRESIMNIRDGDRADKMLPEVYTMIPVSKVFLRPIESPAFPSIGAKAAVDIACERAVQVVLLYGMFIS